MKKVEREDAVGRCPADAMMLLTHSREMGVKISYKRIEMIGLGTAWRC